MKRFCSAALAGTALVVTALAGCASNKPLPRVSYYQLPNVLIHETEGSVGLPQQRLSVSRVSTSDTLAQTGIVTAAADARVITANYHHWSELPELSIQRSLNSCLQTSSVSQAGQISLAVDAFQSDGAGGSQFGGEWSFRSKNSTRDTKKYRFSYRESLHQDGYPALVSALSKSLRQLCIDIETELR